MTEEITRRRFVKVSAVAVGTLVIGGGAVTLATAAPEAELPTYQMGEGEMKVLVVYGTKSGCTSGVAERIGRTLAAKGATVEVAPAQSAGDPGSFDAVVVGSGVRAGQWHEAVRTWVAQNAASLKSRPVAFYTCGMMVTQGAEKVDEVRGYTDSIISETGIEPVDIGVFAGWFEPKQFSFAERAIMKLMKTPQGDFREWDAIESWSGGIAPQLGLAA